MTDAVAMKEEGCSVCGCELPILADTEEWPAPLCEAHAPLDVLDRLDEEVEGAAAVLRELEMEKRGELERAKGAAAAALRELESAARSHGQVLARLERLIGAVRF